MNLNRVICCACLVVASVAQTSAQAVARANASSGSAYGVLAEADFGVEGPDNSSPDCQGGSANDAGNHKAFGAHILQAADAQLGQNVFSFISHIDEDSDRCREFDRVRIEIKGGPSGSTNPELEHNFGDTSYYRWQLRLGEEFKGSSSFTHLFQSKAQGGANGGFPVLTLTARSSILELIHAPADDGSTAVVLASAPLEALRGQWVEVYVRQVHRDEGLLEVRINEVSKGQLLLSYSNDNIDLWRERDNAVFINRPKWGIYRFIADGLQDEEVRFANFCSSEVSAEVCPSLLPSTDGFPGDIRNALPLSGVDNVPLTMPLVWDAAPRATRYTVYFGTETQPDSVATTSLTQYQPELLAATTYYYQIGAVNAEAETRSEVFSFTTLSSPDDGLWEVTRGHAAPHIEASQYFELNTNLEQPAAIDSVKRLNARGTNAAYCYLSTEKEGSNGNYRWRYRQEDGEETTLVMRLAAIPGNNNLAFVEFYGLGWRQKVRINRASATFERTPDDPEFEFPEGFWDDGAYHVIRFTYQSTDGGNMRTTMYLDESETPFASGESDEEKTSSYLDIGRAGSTNYGASFDYIAINPTGAFAPRAGEGSTPPADLLGTAGTRADLPAVVANTLPLDGVVDVPLYMPLTWEATSTATSYNVYLGSDSLVMPLIGDTTESSFAPELRADTTYYYQIGAVNENGETRTTVKRFTTLTTPDDGDWVVARGHARPEVEAAQLFEFATNLNTAAALDTVKIIGEDGSNAAFCYFSGPKEGSNSSYRWRFRENELNETTLLLRLAALPDNDNISYVEFFGLGWRQKIRINSSTLKLERTAGDPEFAFPEGFWDDGAYHVIRFTFSASGTGNMLTSVYLDESDRPFASGESDEDTDSNFIDVGRAGGTDYGACFDYIAINAAGAFAPGVPAGLPSDLVVPDVIVGVQDLREVGVLTLSPNPTSNVLNLHSLQMAATRYQILGLTGRIAQSGVLDAGSNELQVTALPAGAYVIRVVGEDQRVLVARFIKQ